MIVGWLFQWSHVRWTWKKDSTWKIITGDLGTRKVCEKLMPRLLNDNQKCHQVLDLLWWWYMDFWVQNKNDLPEPTVEVSDVVEAEESKIVKVRGIVDSGFLSHCQTINRHIYNEIMRRMIRLLLEKRRGLWQDKSWLLYHNNAPVHNALSIRQFLAERNIAETWTPYQLTWSSDVRFFFSPSKRGHQGYLF